MDILGLLNLIFLHRVLKVYQHPSLHICFMTQCGDLSWTAHSEVHFFTTSNHAIYLTFTFHIKMVWQESLLDYQFSKICPLMGLRYHTSTGYRGGCEFALYTCIGGLKEKAGYYYYPHVLYCLSLWEFLWLQSCFSALNYQIPRSEVVLILIHLICNIWCYMPS